MNDDPLWQLSWQMIQLRLPILRMAADQRTAQWYESMADKAREVKELAERIERLAREKAGEDNEK
jgi:hypothetical protein